MDSSASDLYTTENIDNVEYHLKNRLDAYTDELETV